MSFARKVGRFVIISQVVDDFYEQKWAKVRPADVLFVKLPVGQGF